MILKERWGVGKGRRTILAVFSAHLEPSWARLESPGTSPKNKPKLERFPYRFLSYFGLQTSTISARMAPKSAPIEVR